MKTKVSIITINYKVGKKLLRSIESIIKYQPSVPYEIIVVDNEGDTVLEKQLIKYKNVIYVKSGKNTGFGAGNNLGAKRAKGEYLFFLNPDTEVLPNSINILFDFLEKNKKAGIVSPLIVNDERNTIGYEGYKELTPVNSIFSFTPLRKIFPKMGIFSSYDLKDWKKSPVKQVQTVYGAALMISSKLFNKIKGFDENFFLYFEENDLSKRVRELGFDLYINSNSKIIHEVGQSTKQVGQRDKFFSKSRFLYFRKYYGAFTASILEFLFVINKISISLFFIMAVALFLRIYNLSISMPFIGDIGWFYLSARNLLIYHQIPLVGITSSHIWLHQGPLWTYMLSVALFISNFNPVSGAYITAIFGTLTVFLMYKIGVSLFSRRIGLIAAVLYAVSPLIVFFDREPFDPSPIPLFSLIYLYVIYKWLKGNTGYFPWILFLIAVLYNLELATFTLFFPFALLFIYGLIKKRIWVMALFNKKTIVYSIFGLVVPMMPVIIYDFSHGFVQTIIFLGWTLYKPFSFLIKTQPAGIGYGQLITYLFVNIQKLIFGSNILIALIIFLSGIIYLTYKVYKLYKNGKLKAENPVFLLFFLLFISILGIILNRTPSDAYLPILFPYIIFSVSILFAYLYDIKRIKYLIVLLLFIISVSNFYISYRNSFIPEYKLRVDAANKIIALTKGQDYNLVGIGQGSQYASFTMNYEYLLLWKGHAPSNSNQKLKIIINETPKGILVNKIYD